jgi:hypothetical protein
MAEPSRPCQALYFEPAIARNCGGGNCEVSPSVPTMKLAPVVAICVVLIADCSASSTPKAKPSFSSSLGEDAAILAGHVPGCSNVIAGSSGGLLPGATSEATCKISGHKVSIFGWPNAKDIARAISNLNGETYVARGTGWSEIADDTVTLSAAKSIGEAFVTALGGGTVTKS